MSTYSKAVNDDLLMRRPLNRANVFGLLGDYYALETLRTNDVGFLQNRLAESQLECEALRAENKVLKTQNEGLHAAIDDDVAWGRRIVAKFQDLSTKYLELRDKPSVTDERNELLIAQTERFAARNCALSTENRALTAKYNRLQQVATMIEAELSEVLDANG